MTKEQRSLFSSQIGRLASLGPLPSTQEGVTELVDALIETSRQDQKRAKEIITDIIRRGQYTKCPTPADILDYRTEVVAARPKTNWCGRCNRGWLEVQKPVRNFDNVLSGLSEWQAFESKRSSEELDTAALACGYSCWDELRDHIAEVELVTCVKLCGCALPGSNDEPIDTHAEPPSDAERSDWERFNATNRKRLQEAPARRSKVLALGVPKVTDAEIASVKAQIVANRKGAA